MILFTKNLKLRHFTTQDDAFVLALLNTPAWLTFIGDRNVHTLEDAQNFIEDRFIKSYKAHGFGLYLVQLKLEKTPIGICGLVKRDYLEHPDLGFALLPQFTGQGYGKESSKVVLTHATDLGFNTVLAITNRDNSTASGLLLSLDFKQNGTVIPPDESAELLLFKKELQPKTTLNAL